MLLEIRMWKNHMGLHDRRQLLLQLLLWRALLRVALLWMNLLRRTL